MTRARDIASVLSAATDLATDSELTSAISSSYSSSATITNKIIDGNSNTVHVKRGSTASRPLTATIGDQYYDTTDNILYNYRSDGWQRVSIDPAPIISSISPSTASTTGVTITLSGSYFVTGAAVYFIGTDNIERAASSTTVVSSSSITAITPQLPVAYEPYSVKILNTDNQYFILSSALDAGSSPNWTTASGQIGGSIYEGDSISTSVLATDPDGTSIVYSSSNLPAWLTLNSSSGLITGTAPTVSSDTTYTFTISASDGVNTTSRSFNIVVLDIPTDQYFKYNSLLIHGDGVNNSTNATFLDSSSNNLTITKVANVEQSSVSPFAPSSYGILFPSSAESTTSNVIYSSNAAFALGTSDFTVEFWYKPTSPWTSSTQRFFLQGVGGTSNIEIGKDSGNNNLNVLIQTSTAITYSWSPNIGQWYYIALRRSSGTLALYIDGSVVASTSNSASIGQNQVCIGGIDWAAGYATVGVLSNVRYSNTARTISIPTSNYSADANTLLLMGQKNNGFIDETGKVLSAINGVPRILAIGPYTNDQYNKNLNSGSAYFPGSGDSLTAPSSAVSSIGTGDYSIQCWVYPETFTTDPLGMFRRIWAFGQNTATDVSLNMGNSGEIIFRINDVIKSTSSSNLRLNQWQHVAVSRVSGTTKTFLNGSEVASFADSSNYNSAGTYGLSIGNYPNPIASFKGYISNFKIIKGTGFTVITPSTTPLLDTSGTSILLNFKNQNIFDSRYLSSFNVSGDTKISTSQSKFGGSSIYFDGTSDYLAIRNVGEYFANWYSENAWTLEYWIYPVSLSNIQGSNGNSCVIGHGDISSGSEYWTFGPLNGGTVKFYWWSGSPNALSTTSTISANSWSHLALVKNGSTLTIYINGVNSATTTLSVSPQSSYQFPINIGTNNGTAFTGYLDDIRITKGVARYTSNFTPHTLAHPNK